MFTILVSIRNCLARIFNSAITCTTHNNYINLYDQKILIIFFKECLKKKFTIIKMSDTQVCAFLTAPKHKKRITVYTAIPERFTCSASRESCTPSAFISAAPSKTKKSKQDVIVPLIIPTVNVNECDIFYIDNVIQAMLAQQIASIPLLEQELLFLKSQIITPKIQSQITTLRNKIRDTQSTIDLSYYLYKTSDILSTFKKLSTCHFNSFIQVKIDENIDLKNIQLSNLLSDYISIARNYVTIENYEKKPPIFGCSFCVWIRRARRHSPRVHPTHQPQAHSACWLRATASPSS